LLVLAWLRLLSAYDLDEMRGQFQRQGAHQAAPKSHLLGPQPEHEQWQTR
jgi:hypothetical protein